MSPKPNALRVIVRYGCGCRFVRGGRYAERGPVVTPTPGMPVRCPEHGVTELAEARTVSTKIHRDCPACYGRGKQFRQIGPERWEPVADCRPCAGWGVKKKAS